MSGTIQRSPARTIALPYPIPPGVSLRWPAKDPGDVCDYSLDVSAWLAAAPGDSLASFSVAIAPAPQDEGDLDQSRDAQLDGTVATAWLKGGCAPRDYRVDFHFVTDSGRELDVSAWLTVQELTPSDGRPRPPVIVGARGRTGRQGDRGAAILTGGAPIPPPDLGRTGDTYVVRQTGRIWERRASGWQDTGESIAEAAVGEAEAAAAAAKAAAEEAEAAGEQAGAAAGEQAGAAAGAAAGQAAGASAGAQAGSAAAEPFAQAASSAAAQAAQRAIEAAQAALAAAGAFEGADQARLAAQLARQMAEEAKGLAEASAQAAAVFAAPKLVSLATTAPLRERGNDVPFSEQVGASAWTKTRVTVTDNAATSDGAALSLVVPTTTANTHFFRLDLPVVAGRRQTLIFDAKSAGYPCVRVLFQGTAFPSDQTVAVFDVANGTRWTASAGFETQISPVEGEEGVYRIRIVGRPAETGVASIQFGINDTVINSARSYAGDGVSGILLGRFHSYGGEHDQEYVRTEAEPIHDILAPEEIDGQAPQDGELILVKDATDPVLNGVYLATAPGEPVHRAPLWTDAAALHGTMFVVEGGATQANTAWLCAAPGAVGSAPVTFAPTTIPGADLSLGTASETDGGTRRTLREILNERGLNVRAFGADPTGQRSFARALQAAIDMAYLSAWGRSTCRRAPTGGLLGPIRSSASRPGSTWSAPGAPAPSLSWTSAARTRAREATASSTSPRTRTWRSRASRSSAAALRRRPSSRSWGRASRGGSGLRIAALSMRRANASSSRAAATPAPRCCTRQTSSGRATPVGSLGEA